MKTSSILCILIVSHFARSLILRHRSLLTEDARNPHNFEDIIDDVLEHKFHKTALSKSASRLEKENDGSPAERGLLQVPTPSDSPSQLDNIAPQKKTKALRSKNLGIFGRLGVGSTERRFWVFWVNLHSFREKDSEKGGTSAEEHEQAPEDLEAVDEHRARQSAHEGVLPDFAGLHRELHNEPSQREERRQ